MLDDAVGAFLDTVPERAFDEPLLALLRATGYERVHLGHGGAEFGKDVIAQRDGAQWAFQSKTGNIRQGAWGDIRPQLDLLRTSRLGHPEFNLELPRRPVLVLTGRLTGNAPLLVQEYNEMAREQGEPELEIWDRDELLGRLSGNPDAVLRGSMDGQLLGLLGAIEQHKVDIDAIESFSQRWESWEPERLNGLGMVEAALLCERLRTTERLDLACHLALSAVRAARALGDQEIGQLASDAAGSLFESYARLLWEECDERLLGEKRLVGFSGPAAWVTYALRCSRLAEVIALLALRTSESERELSEEVGEWLADFVEKQPGAARVIGDRYAVSLIPSTLVLARRDRTAAAEYLRQAAVWVFDRYDRGGLGLAAADAGPNEEVTRVLGAAFEFTELQRRASSLATAVILDLAALLGLSDLYADIRNDALAVELYPQVLLPDEGPDRFLRPGLANRWQHNVDYADNLPTNGDAAPHLGAPRDELVDRGHAWDLLAVSAALRDRYFVAAIRAFVKSPP